MHTKPGNSNVGGRDFLARVGPVFGPDTMKAAYQAFDEAWAALAPSVGSDPVAINHARYKLAGAVLAVARNGDTDVKTIKRLALEAVHLGD